MSEDSSLPIDTATTLIRSRASKVKLKDEKRRDQLKRLFREAVGAIPESTITFVENGQMSLV